MSVRYAVAVHRIKEAERCQDPNEQLSWAGNEMASIIREGDSAMIGLPTAWAGLAMVHKVHHEIATAFEMNQHELTEVEGRALYSLKQVAFLFYCSAPFFFFLEEKRKKKRKAEMLFFLYDDSL